MGCDTAEIPCGPYPEGRKGAAEFLRFGGDVWRQRTILRRTLGRSGADVVYVNGPRVLLGAALAAAGRCPLIFHMHNRLRRPAEIAVARGALAIGNSRTIACCRHVAASLPTRSARVIPNGVPDAGYFAPAFPPTGPWRIGMVGRISPDKGHVVLLQAAHCLVAEGYRVSITIAGASLYSSASCAAQVRKYAAGLDVRFTGWVDDVGSLFRELDLLAVPSTAEPGLPRVALEAFSAGLPVVALPTGGIPEAVRDGVTGFLAQDATVQSLAAKLRSVMSCAPEILRQITWNARAEWKSRWNVDRWRREVIAEVRATA